VIATRRRAVAVRIGTVTVGGDAPIVVQSMTNTYTANVEATVRQVRELAEAGSEIVRVTVNNDESAAAVPLIRDRLLAADCDVPLIGDFHFNGHKLLAAHPACAESLAKYRINPGNVGRGSKRDPQFAAMIETACRYRKPVRIGVNWGSLDQDLLTRMMDENSRLPEPQDALEVLREATVVSALASAARAEELGLAHDAIVISSKVSGVQDLIAIYRRLAARCDYPLHLGLTEAGMGPKGIVSSTAAISVLLQEGIGDTIRVSLAADPREEIPVCWDILKSLDLRQRGPTIVACPTCGRIEIDLIPLANRVEEHFQRLGKPLTVAVMGCVVNGPGEARMAHLGIAGGKGRGVIFRKGQVVRTVDEKDFLSALIEEGDKVIADMEGGGAAQKDARPTAV